MAKRVLVVDDEAAIARQVARIVRRALPHAVVEVLHDVAMAQARAAEVTFDLALLDIHIGAGSGVALARALRETSPLVQVAFITGEPGSAEALEARSLAPIAILAKPFSVGELLAVIEAWREGYPTR